MTVIASNMEAVAPCLPGRAGLPAFAMREGCAGSRHVPAHGKRIAL